MCGILGFITSPWQNHAETVLPTLASRGPNHSTTWRSSEAVLSHTRLAVIDLQGGNQPMHSADGRYTLIYNGEIYNFPTLRNELEAKGVVFRSHSDTEVLLHGLITCGEALLPRLDGMFAFALWDNLKRTLLMARDPMGIKPLVYSTSGGGIAFASTLAPFLELPGFPRHIDPEGLRDYLAFQTPMAPHTILHEVRQLPPASLLHYQAESGDLSIERWWHTPSSKKTVDFHDALDRVEHAVRESVKRQMVSDVPLGAFLSGGIDSSLMVRYMSEFAPHRLKTFSMKFAGNHFDESRYALEVSQQLGTEHHVLEAPNLTSDDLVTALEALDQPLADPAYVMTHALSQLTREHVTVAISGDGGDELFGGYSRFRNTEDLYPQHWWQQPLRHGIDLGILPKALLRRTLWGRELLHYRRVELGPWPGRKSLESYLTPDFAPLTRPDMTLHSWLQQINELGGKMDRDTLMRADLWSYLSENCLVKTDRASMAHSLEVRVPLLGKPVVDVALSLPAEIHFQGGDKALLTALARKELPRNVWDRPKHGFSVPLNSLLPGAWHEAASDVLAEVSSLAPFLDAKTINGQWQRTLAGRGSRRLTYTLVVLLIWIRRHRVTV